jgi:hypothetical protein
VQLKQSNATRGDFASLMQEADNLKIEAGKKID